MSESSKWSIATNVDDQELIDENSLLTEDDLKKSELDELGVVTAELQTKEKKERAYNNCSCGLADELEAEKVGAAAETSSNVKSACGNCGLEDAFRCSACPHLGKLPFKPGDAVKTSTVDDT